MFRKNFFGIGAVVLLMVLVVNPIVTSKNFKEEKKISQIEVIDLEIKINECSLVENYIPAAWHESSRVFYELVYTITNNGPTDILTKNLNLKLKILGMDDYPEHQFIFEWTETVKNLYVGKNITLRYEFYNITSSWDPDKDEERYFAGKYFSLNVSIQELDPNPNNNVDIGTIKFWSDSRNYEPTDSQVGVGAPHTYLNISVGRGELWYYVFPFNPENYSAPIRARLGYIWELFMFIYPICSLLKKIIVDFIEFAQIEKNNINIISCWVDDLIKCLLCDIFGKPIPFGFVNLLVDYFRFVKDSVEKIEEQASIWLIPELMNTSESILNIIENFEVWMQSKPWNNNITVQLCVSTVKESHEIEVRCRGVKNEGIGQTMYYFEFEIPSIYEDEFFTWNKKDCTIKVHNWQTNEDKHSMKIFSWAYANGTMKVLRTISFPRNKIKGNLRLFIKEIFSKYQNLKNKILYLFPNFLNNEKYIENNVNNNLNNVRDFDLDVLINNVISEEKKYEPYEVIYKKYCPNISIDPKIVYYSSDQVVVGFKSYVDINNIDEVEGYPIVDKLIELNTVIAEIYGIEPEDFMNIVNQSEDVEYTELNLVYQTCYTPNDPLWNEQWGLRAINCPQAWDKEKGKWTISVAVLDTGCNYLHEDISNKQSSVNYDFVNNDDDPMDDCFVKHGTHCAGIIGATIDNHKGITGAAPNVWTDYIKILDNEGIGYASIIAKGIVHAAKHGDQIISLSLGGYGISTVLHLACDYARYIKGVLIVAAAGNDGLPILCYPARFDSVISVGAVDENLNLCSWSNYGPNLDLVAPGDNIISTVGGNNYDRLSGTSMATPHVASVGALYFSAHSASSTTSCELKLFSTAIDLGKLGNDWKYGYGLVNAYGAVNNIRSINGRSQVFRLLPRFQQLIMNLRLF